jgi:hypothetical protein
MMPMNEALDELAVIGRQTGPAWRPRPSDASRHARGRGRSAS